MPANDKVKEAFIEIQPSSTDSNKSPRLLFAFFMVSTFIIVVVLFVTLYFDTSISSATTYIGYEATKRHNPSIKSFEYRNNKAAERAPVTVSQNQTKAVRFRTDPDIPFSYLFDEARPVAPKSVKLLVIVFTGHGKLERRNAIRATWWQSCKQQKDIACWFFTDSLNSAKDPTVKAKLKEESASNADMVFMPIGNGILFGHRLLYALQWGVSRYDFNFFMRIDDDFLLCVDHLMWDLQNFPTSNLHWGFLHCDMERVVYIDEGITMFSIDIVIKFLSQSANELLCHPFGDQTYTIWLQKIGIDRHLVDHAGNSRIHHHPPASRVGLFETMNDICDAYLALHGVYNTQTMKSFWDRRGTGASYSKFRSGITTCGHEPVMDWQVFGGMYHAVPKLCKEKADWPQGKMTAYPGRE